MSWILTILVFVICILAQARASGVFELRLLSFHNDAGKDDLGKCCTGKSDSNGECEGLCRPRFRVCLKEYQVNIDTTSLCTFGDVMTKELNPNPGSPDRPGYQNPLMEMATFKFNFTWPGSFSLIVEAWHDNGNDSFPVLVSRLTTQRWLDVNDTWTSFVHNSKSSTLKFEYRVTCQPHYYGKGCGNLCRPRDDRFGHYICSPTGQRVCLAGFGGDYCGTPTCTPGCDEQHGHCTKPFECRCQLGWVGPLCDQCERYPGCMHGSCLKPWDCLCDEGWGGLFCNQDLNFCTNHKPCLNGGTCFNTGPGSYTCNCLPGHTGKDCQILSHDCTSTPCLNGGTCNRHTNTTICACPSGYSGPLCEESAKTCADQPCLNGASCTNHDNGYECACRPGFAGTDCEHQLNTCGPNSCKNDGTCVESNHGFQCICPTGYSGERCESNIDDCLGNPCQNGGTCIDKVNEFICRCANDFVGPLCEKKRVDYHYCITKPCANGGICEQLGNEYKCKCTTGFTGRHCGDKVDECALLRPCHNGKCVNRLRGYECRCEPGFMGRDCDEVSSSAAPSARLSSESNLTTEHVVVIATISTFVPLVVFVAVGVIICLKQRRKREKARADEEARLQNEQNTANSSFAKRGGATAMAADAHMIKNSWGKCTNNVISSNISSPDDCSVSNISVSECDGSGFPKPMMQQQQVIDGRPVPVYSLQRTRSQKQLNTEPGLLRNSALLAKLHEPDYEHLKRLSVMSNASAVCASSDLSVLKRPAEKESSGVFVIEEHFHRPDAISAGLFATEV